MAASSHPSTIKAKSASLTLPEHNAKAPVNSGREDLLLSPLGAVVVVASPRQRIVAGTPTVEIESENERHQMMRRYARALCNVVACGNEDERTEAQVRMIKACLRSKGCASDVVDCVDALLEGASQLDDEELVCETHFLIRESSLRVLKEPLVQDMYHVAAVNDFPESQVYAASLVASFVGIPLDEICYMENTAERQQRQGELVVGI
jgi:hypothetical protein